MAKFREQCHYSSVLDSGYKILPFSFTSLDENRYVATNVAGEYIVIERNDLYDFAQHKLDNASEIYNDLKSKHFLYDDDSNVAIDLLALKQRTKLRRLSDFTGLHMFVVSLRCEHSCPYCQVSRANNDAMKAKFDMTQDVADKALAMTFRSPSPAIKVEFQGGESLLNFDIIKYIVQKAKQINETEQRDLQFVIATNLALVEEDILEFCKEHNILISTSLDGPKELHNKNRPRPGNNSYEKTIEGIEKCREILGPERVSALMTTTKESISQPIEIIDEYIAQKFNGIFLRPLSPYGFAIKTKFFRAYGFQEWLDFYFEGLEYIIELNKNGFFFIEQYAATILSKMLTPYATGYVDLMSPAGIGIGAVIYNYDGDVYASDEGRMLAEMDDKSFRLGNVKENTYEEIFTSETLLDAIEESYTGSVPMCSECAFEVYCGSDPVYHHATQKDFVGHKPSSEFCGRNMSIFKRLIDMMEADAQVKEVFYSWVRM